MVMENDPMVKSRTGSVDAEGLYRRYGPMVLRRCRRMLRNEDTAADAMQETFVRVLRRQGDLVVAHPSSLLYRIATNVCLNVLRDSRRRPLISAEPLLPMLEGRDRLEERLLDSFVVEQVFSGAREGTREAAEMLFLEGRTLAETAREVDLSISGVRKRIRTLREHNLPLLQQ
jgi:RNA polymerase sigma-70 factor (ECF subfamily)